MGRRKNSQKSVPVTITASPKMILYLDDLIAEEGYGNTRGEVARQLIWKSLEGLLRDGIIDRRKGPIDD